MSEMHPEKTVICHLCSIPMVPNGRGALLCKVCDGPDIGSDDYDRDPRPTVLVKCRHCGRKGKPGFDHTCPCPNSDAECKEHP